MQATARPSADLAGTVVGCIDHWKGGCPAFAHLSGTRTLSCTTWLSEALLPPLRVSLVPRLVLYMLFLWLEVTV